MNAIRLLRSSLKIPTNKPEQVLKSKAHNLLSYHPADINLKSFANQDLELRPLKLRDVWVEQRYRREVFAKTRGKSVRVSVLFGRTRSAGKASDKKKKKKK
ncbi:hypothetical protein HDU92_007327 [Lobulomyces angularis]|nr:hypothetical protein HDU92_007327 [Lobulomyces angularis]